MSSDHPQSPAKGMAPGGPRSGTRPGRHSSDVVALRALVREATTAPVPEVDWSGMEARLGGAIASSAGTASEGDLRGQDRQQARIGVGSSPSASRSTRTWVAAVGLTAAAAVAVFVALGERAPHIEARGHEPLPPSTLAAQGLRPGGQLAAPQDARALAVGAVVTADRSPVSYRDEGRATWSLAEGSRVRIVSFGSGSLGANGAEQESLIIALDQGSVHAEVVPQAKPESFVVEVGAVRVAVHGTSFTVTRGTDRVDVEVMQGVVAVRPMAETDGTKSELVSGGEHASFALDGSAATRWATRSPDHRDPATESAKPRTDGRPAAPVVAAAPGAAATPARRSSSPKAASPTSGVVLAHIVDGIATCYELQVASSGADFSVESSLALTVGSSGTATDSVFDPPLSPTLMACAEQAIAAARFPLNERGRRFVTPIHLAKKP